MIRANPWTKATAYSRALSYLLAPQNKKEWTPWEHLFIIHKDVFYANGKGYSRAVPDIDEDISAEGMLYGIPAPRS